MISPDAIKISNNIVYSWGYIMLLVDLDIQENLSFDSNLFYRKDEFHISIFNGKKYLSQIALANNVSIIHASQLVTDAVRQVIQDKKFSVVLRENALYLAEQKDQKSILVLVDIPVLEDFLKDLSGKLGINIEPFPPHITLYTLANKVSIAINNFDDFQTFCHPINLNLDISSQATGF